MYGPYKGGTDSSERVVGQPGEAIQPRAGWQQSQADENKRMRQGKGNPTMSRTRGNTSLSLNFTGRSRSQSKSNLDRRGASRARVREPLCSSPGGCQSPCESAGQRMDDCRHTAGSRAQYGPLQLHHKRGRESLEANPLDAIALLGTHLTLVRVGSLQQVALDKLLQ